ncbi:MAG: glycosyltransferase family 2 protein [Bacteroidia bacterium]|nr:glycosyltransferase family 2 protein [Bacteroidia bacterium]
MTDATNLPLVSIIIPYFNHGSFINETINSIKNQNYKNLEIIIIDDCSTSEEASKAVLNQSSLTIQFLKTKLNSGPSIARNIGIAASNGKYILPLDGDDKLGDPFLTDAVQFLESNLNYQVVYGNGSKFGASNEFLSIPNFEKFNFLTYNPLFVTSVIRKSALETAGLYDEYLSKLGLEDWELWLSFAELNYSFKKFEKTFLHIRVLENSRTFQVANKNLDPILEYIYKKHWKLLLDEFKLKTSQLVDIQRSREFKLGKNILLPLRLLIALFRKN